MEHSTERLEINNLRQEAGYLYEDTSTLHQKLDARQRENEHLQENLKIANEKAERFQNECQEKDKLIQCMYQQNIELKKQLSKSEEDKDLHVTTLKELVNTNEEIRVLKKLKQEKSDEIKELQWGKEEVFARCLDYERLRKIEAQSERIHRYELQEQRHRNDKIEEELQRALEQIQILEKHVQEFQEIRHRNDKVEEELQRARDRIQMLERHVHAHPQSTDSQFPENLHGHFQWIEGDFFCGRCYDLICHPGRKGTRRNISSTDNQQDNLVTTFQNRRVVVAASLMQSV